MFAASSLGGLPCIASSLLILSAIVNMGVRGA